MFYRLHTDGTPQPVPLTNLYAGPTRSWCWIICGGPSLSQLPMDAIAASPAPKFAVNLAGTGLLRPNFWTSYDPTGRFLRSIYLDASVCKFVHSCRSTDLISESTHKVCDAPATFFFERDRNRGFHNFLTHAPGAAGIVDWQDSFVQALDIAFHLGFRRLLLAGCDMFISPSARQQARAQEFDVVYQSRELLRDFFARCRAKGLPDEELSQLELPQQYHFDERKPLAAAIQTDDHYFRVAQSLRLSRRSIALAGVELISVTPVSRLNDYFEYWPIEFAIDQIHHDVGDPGRESVTGRYTSPGNPHAPHLGPMRDFRPHFWKPAPVKPAAPLKKTAATPARPLRQQLDRLCDIDIPIQEIG